MRLFVVVLLFALLAAGCASSSERRLKMQIVALARENAALKARLVAQSQGVMIEGPVANPFVPWVVGLTLTQAIATANYLDPKPPREITIIRNGESAKLDASVLLNGTPVPLQPGDQVQIEP